MKKRTKPKYVEVPETCICKYTGGVMCSYCKLRKAIDNMDSAGGTGGR